MKILNTIGECFSEPAKQMLGSHDVTYATLSQPDLANEIQEYDVVICGLGLTFDRSVLDKSKNLKVIATATTGLDHIDTVHASKSGITVLSLRDDAEFLRSITGTAELAFGLLIDLARKSPFAFDDVRLGKWDREAFRGHMLHGKVLGIVGAGRLGAMMATYGHAFGMKILFVDPNVETLAVPAARVSLGTLLKESDAVSLHVHLLPETENIMDAAAIEKMKPSAYLINTARGGLVDEPAVLMALQDSRIAGYAADVLARELSFKNNSIPDDPLVEYAKRHSNCIIVPHIGGMTHESRAATDKRIAQKLAEYLMLR